MAELPFTNGVDLLRCLFTLGLRTEHVLELADCLCMPDMRHAQKLISADCELVRVFMGIAARSRS